MDKKRRASGISGGIFLIALGVITLVKVFYLKDEVEEVADIGETV